MKRSKDKITPHLEWDRTSLFLALALIAILLTLISQH